MPLTDRKHARRLQFITAHAKEGGLPEDVDWRGLADPATTTAIYMPAKTLAGLVGKAVANGLDPAMPAIAIARATRRDQAVVAAPIAELTSRLGELGQAGPILVILGAACAAANAAQEAERPLFHMRSP